MAWLRPEVGSYTGTKLYYILEGLEWGESTITFRMGGVFHYPKLLIIKTFSDIKNIELSACLEYLIFFLKIL